MATYTIHQQPALYQPAYNDLIFVVNSSNSGQTNFNYIAQLYVGSDIITIKAPADPTYGSGVFNFGRIVESYVNSDIGDGTYGFQQNSNSFKSYYVKFGEEYGSTITQYLAITTTAVKYVWNGVLDFLAFQNFNYTTYSADTNKILSESITRCIELTQDAWLYFFTNDTAAYDKAIVNAFNSAGTQIRGVEVSNPYTSSGTIANHFIRFSSGPQNLNLISSGVITNTVGSGDVIPSTTSYYTVQFDGGAASDMLRFNIGCGCGGNKYDVYRLHFLNELGAFESFNFTMVSRTTTDIKKNQYKAPVGALTSASAFGYNKKDRVDRQYFISSKDTIRLKTDWLTEDESTWLRELVESPEIYLDDSTHGLVSVTCQQTNYEQRKYVNEKLFQLEIEIQYSFNRYRQRY